MNDVLKWIQFSIALLPMVLQGITLAEDAIGSGNGPAKKALVMAGMQPAFSATDDGATAVTVASNLIDHAVAAKNLARQLPGTHVAAAAAA